MNNFDDLLNHALWGMEQQNKDSSDMKLANLLYGTYSAFVKAGFTDTQAMYLVVEMLHASAEAAGRGE